MECRQQSGALLLPYLLTTFEPTYLLLPLCEKDKLGGDHRLAATDAHGDLHALDAGALLLSIVKIKLERCGYTPRRELCFLGHELLSCLKTGEVKRWVSVGMA